MASDSWNPESIGDSTCGGDSTGLTSSGHISTTFSEHWGHGGMFLPPWPQDLRPLVVDWADFTDEKSARTKRHNFIHIAERQRALRNPWISNVTFVIKIRFHQPFRVLRLARESVMMFVQVRHYEIVLHNDYCDFFSPRKPRMRRMNFRWSSLEYLCSGVYMQPSFDISYFGNLAIIAC